MPHANVQRKPEAAVSNAAYVQCPQMQSNFSIPMFRVLLLFLLLFFFLPYSRALLGVLAIWLARPNVWATTSTSVNCRLSALRHRLVLPYLIGANVVAALCVVFTVFTEEGKVKKEAELE